MAGSTHLHEELGALQAELRKAPGPQAEQPSRRALPLSDDGSASAPPSASVADLEDQLRELGKALSDYTGNAEELIAEHPLLSVLAAFALGVAVGKMMGRA